MYLKHTHTHLHAHTNKYIHVCMYISVFIHMHTYTCSQILQLFLSPYTRRAFMRKFLIVQSEDYVFDS